MTVPKVEKRQIAEAAMIEDLDFRIWMLLFGGVLSLIALVSKPWIEAAWRGSQEKKALKGELEDLIRHMDANRKVLDTMDFDKGMPLNMHFRKLSIPDTIILFSDDAFRHLPPKWQQNVFQLRLMIRNFNLEIEEALDAAKNNEVETLRDLSRYIMAKTDTIKTRITDLLKAFYKPKAKKIKSGQADPGQPVPILYKKPGRKQPAKGVKAPAPGDPVGGPRDRFKVPGSG